MGTQEESERKHWGDTEFGWAAGWALLLLGFAAFLAAMLWGGALLAR